MTNIPESHKDLLLDEKKAFAVLATLMDDGTPQATPIWFSSDGQNILINSAKGRRKDVNMRQHPEVALVLLDPQNPYRYLQIRGRVAEITEQGADEHIDFLAGKYTGDPHYKGHVPGQVRVIYKIEPENISKYG